MNFIRINSSDVLSGEIWVFMSEDKEQNPLSKDIRSASGFSWFRALLERFRGVFWQVFTLSVAINMLALAVPLFVMFVYDKVISANSPDTLYPLLMGVGLALVIELILRTIRAGTLSWFGARLDYIVGVNVFERLMMMPAIFTERASVSSQINRLKAFEAVRDFFTGSLFLSVIELPFTIVLLVAIVLIAGPVVFVPIVMAVLYIILLLSMRHSIRTQMKLSGKASSDRQQMIIETFDKMDGLRMGGLTSVWFQQFRDYSGKNSLASFRASYLSSFVDTLAHAIYILAGMSVLVWGIERIWAGHMTTGALIATMILSWRVISPIQTFCVSLPRYEQLENAVAQINRLMEIETEVKESQVKARLNNVKGQITFSKVGLRYTKDTDPVFAGLSFDAKPGQLISITGNNGSGKSTILKLLNGLYKPQAGSIRVDGIDIRQLEPHNLRRNIAYVPQKPTLFTGTIAENLRFVNPLASDEELKEAFRKTGGLEYIEKLSNGLDTMVGSGASAETEKNEKIPAIFYYHIGLARAYIKDVPIMIFDELPYAFLNAKSGELFKTMLKDWKGRRTVFIVTHREDYISLADQAVLLRKGQMPLVGRPDQVSEAIYKSYEVNDD